MKPIVSAVITTHNRPDLLKRALQSALCQTYENLEIVVVDDGSSDETRKTVHDYMNKGRDIRYLRNEVPRGACAARNRGIREARGAFIAGLDDDDEWLPQRVELLLGNYRDRYAYLCSRDLIIDKNGEKLRTGPPLITLGDMLYKNVTGNQVLTRKDRILAVGGFDEGLTSAQDYDLWLRLLTRYGPAKRVPEVLQRVYRDHETGRVSLAPGKISGEWHLYQKHKGQMTRRQRRVHLLELRRLKRKKIRLAELLLIANTGHLKFYATYYLRFALGRI